MGKAKDIYFSVLSKIAAARKLKRNSFEYPELQEELQRDPAAIA